jgi:hypothetical protein
MNTVVLKHTKDKIDALESQLRENAGKELFNLLFPRPAEEEENWYEWNVSNWGTKWDVFLDDTSIERIDDETLSLTFDTAWSPPIGFYNFLFEEGWDVTAKYYEPGMGFVGEYDNSIDDCWEYDLDNESTLEAIPTELREWSGVDDDFEFHKDLKEIEGEEDAE